MAHSTLCEPTRRFFPVHLESLDHQALEMDLYLRHQKNAEPTLYRANGVPFHAADAARLRQAGVEFLYIPAEQHAVYRRALNQRLDRIFDDRRHAVAERSRLVRASCTRMIEDILLFPDSPQPVASIADVGRSFSAWSLESPEEFSYLLDMSEHDFYTATHMVNVGVGCGLLAREIHPQDDDLFAAVVQGGLLHDVGKRGIPETILNKEGKLEPREWDLIRSHPLNGFRELGRSRDIPQPVLLMVRDHHERLDGSGYPAGLAHNQISFHSRICAVVDVFDAITAARPYRGPTPPLETIKIMMEGRGTQFDAQVLDAWAALVTRLVEQDPARAVPPRAESDDQPRFCLTALLPCPPVTRDSGPGHNRRRFPRFPCDVRIRAAFIDDGKAHLAGEWFTLRVADLSRGGAKLELACPVSLNDRLCLELPTRDGHTVTRHVRIVHVRRRGPTTWATGAQFLQSPARANPKAA